MAAMTAECRGPDPVVATGGRTAGSGQPGDGALTMFVTGSIFRAANSPSGLTLVEPDADPDWGFQGHWAYGHPTGGRLGTRSRSREDAAFFHPAIIEIRFYLQKSRARY